MNQLYIKNNELDKADRFIKKNRFAQVTVWEAEIPNR